MSFNLYDFVVTIKADATQADAAIASSSGGLGNLAQKFGGAKAIGVAAFAALGVAAGKFASEAVQVGMEFDKSMSQVAATMGITNAEMENVMVTSGDFQGSLRDLAIEMGSKTAFSATQASEALNYMALAGYDAQTSADMLPKVLDLAAAGAMDLARASDMVTDSQTALGLSIDETEVLVDQMAQTASKSNTSVEQLGDAILRVGGTAKGLKGGTTELNTALGILADNGTKGAEGGTALRNVLLGIKGAKFEKTFGALGVSAYDAQGNLRSLEDVFLDMQDAMDGMTQEQRDEIITKTFNKADLKNVNALLGTSKERWDELTASIEDSEGAAAQMAETQLDNLAGDVTLFQSALEGLQIAISDGLSPALRGFVQSGSEGLGKIQKAFGEGGLGAGLAAFIESFGDMSGLFVEKVMQLPGLLATTLANNSGEIITAGLDLVISLVEGIFKGIPSLFQAAPKIITGLAKSLTQNFPKILAKGGELIKTLAKGIISMIPLMPKTSAQVMVALVKGITMMLKQFPSLGLDIVRGIWQGISNGKEWIKGQIKGWVGDVKAFFKNLFGIKSPSKWARNEIGFRIPQGVALGILDGKKDVEDAMEELMPDDYEYETAIISGGFSDAITLSVKGAMENVISQMVPELQESMAQALEGVQVKLDGRKFGRLTREAVNGAI